jgi:hypothetical protein
VVQPGLGPDLALEAGAPQGGAQGGVENLEGHPPAVPEILRQVHRRTRAPAQLPFDQILVRQRCRHVVARVGHGLVQWKGEDPNLDPILTAHHRWAKAPHGAGLVHEYRVAPFVIGVHLGRPPTLQ